MPILTLQPAPDGEDNGEGWTLIPDSKKVIVEVTGIKDREMPFKDERGQTVIRLSFEFRVIDGEYKGLKLDQDVYYEFTESRRCRLYTWTKELYGTDRLPANFTLDTDDLVGKQAIATVGVREWTGSDGNIGKRNTVKWLQRIDTSAPAPVSVSTPTSALFDDSEPF